MWSGHFIRGWLIGKTKSPGLAHCAVSQAPCDRPSHTGVPGHRDWSFRVFQAREGKDSATTSGILHVGETIGLAKRYGQSNTLALWLPIRADRRMRECHTKRLVGRAERGGKM